MDEGTIRQVASRTLSDDVAAVIRDAILSGEFAPGEKLNQSQLAERLGTSRGPVREGLKQLREEGLVEEIPHKGSYVIEISSTYISELYSLRRALEAFAVECAIARATEQDLKALEDLYSEMQQLDPSVDPDTSADRDVTFHYLIARAAHHELLLRIWKSIEAGLRLCLAHRYRGYRNPQRHVVAHGDILEALKARDGERAKEVLNDHIKEAEVAMLNSIMLPPMEDGAGPNAEKKAQQR